MAERNAARATRSGGKRPPEALLNARLRAQKRADAGAAAAKGGTMAEVVPLKRPRSRKAVAPLGGAEYTIMGLVLLMSLFGMVMIFSASSGLALDAYGSSYYFLVRQAMWFAAGIAAMVALAGMDYRRVLKSSPYLVVISLAALSAVLAFGVDVYGSRRSLVIGPLVIQPSEFAKLSVLLFSVHCYSRLKRRPEAWSEVVFPALAVAAANCLLILLEPDLGTAFVVGAAAFFALFLAGAPWRRVLPLVAGGAAATALVIFSSEYRRVRFLSFIDPWKSPRAGGFQIIQSMLALGSGRFTGLGLGMSRQKFFYLPNAHTDFIFSIIGEEAGLLGTLGVVCLFAILLFLGLRTARRAPDGAGRLLAMGAAGLLVLQALVNMGAATGVLPITGITLPFFSYGGSSLVVCFCFTGILLNVSRQGSANAGAAERRVQGEDSHMRRRNRRASSPAARPGRGAGTA